MSGGNSKRTMPTSSNDIAATAASSNASYSKQRIIQNFVLIWADTNIDQSKKYYQDTLTQLRRVCNNIDTYILPEPCVQHLKGISNRKAFIIVSDALGKNLVPDIHPLPQVEAIYIFSRNKSAHERWTENWSKIKGVFYEI